MMSALKAGQTIIAHGITLTAIKPTIVLRASNGDMWLVRDSQDIKISESLKIGEVNA